MDIKTYERISENDFIGRKVKSLVPFRSGMFKFPVGITLTIRRKYGGFELITDPCPHCGVAAYINKVRPRDVELIEAEGK